MFRRTFSAIALSIGFLFTGADATAQIVPAARIVVLPSANPGISDRVTARITYEQIACYTFTSALTTQPGGVFEVRITPITFNQPFPCTQTFDVDLGVLPAGNYIVLFYVQNVVLASAAFAVGAVPIPAIGEGGIGALAIVLALVALLVGAKARRKAGSDVLRSIFVLSSATIVGVLGNVPSVVAADLASSGVFTDLIIRFDRKIEVRTVQEIVALVNARRDFSLSSRLLQPSAARRLIRREPTAYERDIVARHPSALVSQMFEYIVLSYDNVPDLQATADSLRREPSVKSVERVQLMRPAFDPLLGSPGGTSNNSQWGFHALSLPSAWLKTKGRAAIAYFDSGLVTTHEDLLANFRPHLSRNVTSGTTATSYLEDEFWVAGTNYPGHGTHVAGILAATTDNNLGVSGGCPKCSLIATNRLLKNSPNRIAPV